MSDPALPQPPKWTPPPTPPAQGGAPLTLAAFQRLIYDRYFPTDSARGTPGTFMWLIEEVGELATALQDNAPGKAPTPEQRANLAEEFADVLAWLTTLANIAGVDLEQACSKYLEPGRVEGVKD
ncbi:MAG: MazG nucleotide pyrophosphohydrolase domain-containing protein [Phycisphaerales bacterium]|jgi:NTP pyrophosphatase (non-canonical NTP hydrolase)|nr:MazG nucleotide pyrophosphohydrolase domain-containing protein [Phycisphaerales bacterium]